MNKIAFLMVVLLVGGLFAGSAFALDPNVMTLTPGFVDSLSVMPSFDCLMAVDFEALGLSEAIIFPSLAALYGFDFAGSGGLSGGGNTNPMACTVNWGYERCGSCTYHYYEGNQRLEAPGRIKYNEMWCLGIRVIRDESCWRC